MSPTNQTVTESGITADAENSNLRPATEGEGGMTVEAQPGSRVVSERTGSSEQSRLIEQYGCGPVRFTGRNDALYERHLVFDNVMDATAIGERERFEAVGRSVRDVLSQRWILTEQTYNRENPKRLYYFSMEYLIGRSLANNITNLLLDSIVDQTIKQQNIQTTKHPNNVWEHNRILGGGRYNIQRRY